MKSTKNYIFDGNIVVHWWNWQMLSRAEANQKQQFLMLLKRSNIDRIQYKQFTQGKHDYHFHRIVSTIRITNG